MKKILTYILIGLLVLGIGIMLGYYAQKSWEAQEALEEFPETTLSVKEAINIAKRSECIAEGSLSGEYIYNDSKNTWILKMDPRSKKEGCIPYCEIIEETEEAIVKWVCKDWNPSEGGLSENEAINIAQNSACMADGVLNGKNVYEEYANRWSLGMDVDKEQCFAVCQINEETRKAETAWRCTGLELDELE